MEPNKQAQALESLKRLIPLAPISGGAYQRTTQLTFVQVKRAGERRQYLILVAHNNEVYDITSTVCKARGYRWNQTSGTLSTTSHAEDIASNLAFSLYGTSAYIPVQVL